MENVIHEEFFEQKPSSMKCIYYLYSLIGGMCYENYLTSKFRYLWICFVGVAYITNTLATMTIFIQKHQLSFYGLEVSWISCMFGQIWLLIMIVISFKREHFHTFFDSIHEALNETNLSTRFYHPTDTEGISKESSLKKFTISAGSCHVISVLIIYFFKLCKKINDSLDGDFRIDYEYDFIYPFPFLNSQSIATYVIIYHLTFTYVMLYSVMIHGLILFPFVSSIVFKNIMIPSSAKQVPISLCNGWQIFLCV